MRAGRIGPVILALAVLLDVLVPLPAAGLVLDRGKGGEDAQIRGVRPQLGEAQLDGIAVIAQEGDLAGVLAAVPERLVFRAHNPGSALQRGQGTLEETFHVRAGAALQHGQAEHRALVILEGKGRLPVDVVADAVVEGLVVLEQLPALMRAAGGIEARQGAEEGLIRLAQPVAADLEQQGLAAVGGPRRRGRRRGQRGGGPGLHDGQEVGQLQLHRLHLLERGLPQRILVEADQRRELRLREFRRIDLHHLGLEALVGQLPLQHGLDGGRLLREHLGDGVRRGPGGRPLHHLQGDLFIDEGAHDGGELLPGPGQRQELADRGVFGRLRPRGGGGRQQQGEQEEGKSQG